MPLRDNAELWKEIKGIVTGASSYFGLTERTQFAIRILDSVDRALTATEYDRGVKAGLAAAAKILRMAGTYTMTEGADPVEWMARVIDARAIDGDVAALTAIGRATRDIILDICLDVQQRRATVYEAADRIEAATGPGSGPWCDCPPGRCDSGSQSSKVCRIAANIPKHAAPQTDHRAAPCGCAPGDCAIEAGATTEAMVGSRCRLYSNLVITPAQAPATPPSGSPPKKGPETR